MAVSLAGPKPERLGRLLKYSDLLVGVAAVVVVGMMVMPMPNWLLDMLLTLNITAALTILLVTAYSTEPLQFASFPAMLLVTTLFRLGLNIAATRLILLNGDAGAVIAAFGNVVVGGNYVVGVVVFAILIIIQFVVITNGTGRVAEVAARFTLDAMPGKQMAIDADLNAGIINEEEAQRRRRTISRESDFYGAMDGASKFVRGDAIAAVVMILVNVLGGFMVGVAQRHMDLATALRTYTLLTVGEGLVTQIPALLVSTATGLMVTKASSENSIGGEMISQIAQPKALAATAAISGVLAFIPGLPKLPFLMIACGCGALAYLLRHRAAPGQEIAPKPDPPKAPESMTDLLGVDAIELELGYGIIPLADVKQGGDLLERITAIRRRAAVEMGILVPAIRVRDNLQLKPNDYCVKLRGVEIARGQVYPGQALAMNPGGVTAELRGIETVEPAFGLPAIWIPEAQQSEAELAGYTVVDPLTVLVTHLTELIRSYAQELLTRQNTQTLIDTVKQDAPALIEELVPHVLGIGEIQKSLQNLLAERVSIRDLSAILEALADGGRLTKDTDLLTEYVRQALARQVTSQNQCDDGVVRAFTLDPQLEQMLAEGLRQTDNGVQLVIDPSLAQQVLEATRSQVEQMAAKGYQPVGLCSPRIRFHYRRLIGGMAPTLAVLSYNEISAGTRLETVGMVTLADESSKN
ncbi:MAG: flagellar biosynthesis protein FlhA [Armatimonadota bacterium]|nr:flagellar biosynthesis protein FlhA [Armatimonadota bacterium]